jgi:hypothetical protein
MTGQPGQDSLDRSFRTGQLGKDIQDRTAGTDNRHNKTKTGQRGQDIKDRTAGTGQPRPDNRDRTARQESLNRILYQDSLDWADGTSQQGQVSQAGQTRQVS